MVLQKITTQWKNGGFGRFELVVALLFCLTLIPTLRNITEENDINIFYKAAESLRQGKSPYAAPHMYGMWYYYSPLFAAALVPFTFFPLQVIKVVWLALGIVMVFRTYRIATFFIPFPKNKEGMWFTGIVAAVAAHPVFMNLLYGQMTILIVWCCVEGIYQMVKPNETKAATAFAIGINIKLLPLFFFFPFLLKKNFRFMLKLAAAVVILILLPYLFISPAFHTDLISQWFGMINPLNDEHINTAGEGGFTDFASLVTKYFTAIAISTEGQLNIANLTEYEVFLVQNVFRLLVLVTTAWMVLRVNRHFKPLNLREFADLSFVLLCTIVAFPHQRDYSVMLGMPAFALVIYSYVILGFRPQKILVIAITISAIGMGFLLFPQLFGYDLKYFFFEKRIPGISTLLFIPLYMVWMYKLRNTEVLRTKP